MRVNVTRASLLDDPYLAPYAEIIRGRAAAAARGLESWRRAGSLAEFACAHEVITVCTARRWMDLSRVGAECDGIWLVGDFTGWRVLDDFSCIGYRGGTFGN
jgi:hypothetical protein